MKFINVAHHAMKCISCSVQFDKIWSRVNACMESTNVWYICYSA